MKRWRGWFAWLAFLSMCSASGKAAELRLQDLKGFRYANGIVAYQKIKLPDPKPPKEGGITTGTVFILGRYLPPPYEVTVEGVQLMINGVPCSSFQRLLQTEEERAAARRQEVTLPIEMSLLDTYQRAKWYEGREAAERRLQEALAALSDVRLLGFERRPFDPGAVPGAFYHLGQALGGNYPGFEHVQPVELGEVPTITVHLEHAVMGSFSVEVESPRAQWGWVDYHGIKMLQTRVHELEQLGHRDKAGIAEQVIAYARAQPWVKSFDLADNDPHKMVLNGRSVLWNYQECSPEGTPRETIAEREQRDHEAALNDAKPRVEAALREGGAVLCGPGGVAIHGHLEILEPIRRIVAATPDHHERRTRLIEVLKPLLGPDAEKFAEHVAVFWSEMGAHR